MTNTATTTEAPATLDLSTLVVTRFDIRETEDGDELRLFHKRTKVGAMGTEDLDGDALEGLAEWLAANPEANSLQVEAYLTGEDGDEDEEASEGGSIVPEEYRKRYGAEQHCGDDVAVVLKAYTASVETNEKGKAVEGLDLSKLAAVCETNGIGDKLAGWQDANLNNGQLRMGAGNVLRGMLRRGEQVTIGEKVWPADPSKLEARKEARTSARKAAAAAKKAAKTA